MKKSLSSKVLVLSVAALVMAGSGCERRGRAPVKAAPIDTAAGADGGKTTANPTTPGKVDPTKTIITNAEVSNDETLLIKESGVSCPNIGDNLVNIIVATNTANAESMNTDTLMMNKLRDCLGGGDQLKGFGVKSLRIPDPATKIVSWVILGGEMNAAGEELDADGKVAKVKSPLLTAFEAEATATGLDDEKVAKVIKSRIRILKLNAEKMLTKYASLDGSTKYDTDGNTVGMTLPNFGKVSKACDSAEKVVDTYWTVRSGKSRLETVDMDADQAAMAKSLSRD